jgi:hypothetical protein
VVLPSRSTHVLIREFEPASATRARRLPRVCSSSAVLRLFGSGCNCCVTHPTSHLHNPHLFASVVPCSTPHFPNASPVPVACSASAVLTRRSLVPQVCSPALSPHLRISNVMCAPEACLCVPANVLSCPWHVLSFVVSRNNQSLHAFCYASCRSQSPLLLVTVVW